MRELTKIKYIIIGILFPSMPLIGQIYPVDTTTTIFQKIVNDSIRNITLEADFDSLFNYKKLTAEQKAKLTISCPNGVTSSYKIKVKTRGVYRRMKCEIPPLRINFNDKVLAATGLNKRYDKLKLVTHCVENEKGEQALLKEYWTYKLYNQVTPNSFNVHLVKITYINTRDTFNQIQRFAFLIENSEEMAHRLGGELVENYGMTPSKLVAADHQNVMLFNYMIGNLDWHIERKRNVKLVRLKKQKKLTVVPYDFDMSAIVFPSYARLNPDYGQTDIRQRFCVGRFASKVALEETIGKFTSIKNACVTAFMNCSYLSKSSKVGMESYLNSFYRKVKKKKKLKRTFM